MADPPPTRLHVDPPIDQWRVTPRNGRATPVIATGHQPYLWHPGILAKDLAADAFARQVGGTALHVVVEHNPLGALAIDVPTRRGRALGTRSLVFADVAASSALPPNRLPAIEPAPIHRAIHSAGDLADQSIARELNQVAEAYAAHAGLPHQAAQTTAALATLKQPYLTQPMQTLATSRLVTQGFVDRLLSDPVGCVRCYNRAAMACPQADIRPLYAGRDVVEAPLWAQADGVCTPVFVDLGDSKQPLLFTQGQALDLTGPDALKNLRPRAVTLSAIMRSEHCDLFIHGTGGGIYDRVTERWWRDWVGEDLAPMAVVSADVYLPFDVPTATREQRRRAQWFAHHLPHNVDRYTDAADHEETKLRREKQELLDHMNDDRNKRRRARAFQRVHAINAELGERHHEAINKANQQAEDARVGRRNARIASRRDWCFALYPKDQLWSLAEQVRSCLLPSPR